MTNYYNDDDRDKFLVEAMDEEYIDRDGKSIVEIVATLYEQDFDTWDGFGHLLNWAKDEDWWEEFIGEYGVVICKDENAQPEHYLPVDLMVPDKFADAVMDFLQEMEDTEEDDKQPDEDAWKTTQ